MYPTSQLSKTNIVKHGPFACRIIAARGIQPTFRNSFLSVFHSVKVYIRPSLQHTRSKVLFNSLESVVAILVRGFVLLPWHTFA